MEEETSDMTYDDEFFYDDNGINYNYSFNKSTGVLKMWYMDFYSFSFVWEEMD